MSFVLFLITFSTVFLCVNVNISVERANLGDQDGDQSRCRHILTDCVGFIKPNPPFLNIFLLACVGIYGTSRNQITVFIVGRCAKLI